MPGTKVRKMHSSRRDAFKVINSKPFAKIFSDRIDKISDYNLSSNKKLKLDTKFEEKVALIKIYPGQDPDIIDYYFQKGYKGLVLELTGIGQVPTQDAKYNWLPKIKKAIDAGMVICGACQTLYGRLNSKVYSAGRDLEKTGLIFLEDILPETAFVKLGWVLGHKEWIRENKIKEKMLHNFAGEFNNRLEFEF